MYFCIRHPRKEMKPQQVRTSSDEEESSWRQQKIKVKEMVEVFHIE